MSVTYDNDALVEQIKSKASLADGRYESQELLDLAYMQMLSVVYPIIISMREEYFVRFIDTPIIPGQFRYPVTERALNGALRDVQVIVGDEVRRIERIDIQEIGSVGDGEPCAFFLMGDEICLYKNPTVSGYILRQYFFISPGRLVPLAEVARIESIDVATKSCSIGAVPTGWTTGNTFDFQKGSAGYKYLGLDLTATLVTTTMTFADDLPPDLVVGDYITLAGEAGFPQIPKAQQPLLVQSTVSTVLGSIGHTEAAIASKSIEGEIKGASLAVMATRIQGAPRKFRTTLY